MRVGKYYRVTNKRLKEEFVLKCIGKNLVYLYWRNTPRNASPHYLGECEFPYEEGDVEIELKKTQVFMEVI